MASAYAKCIGVTTDPKKDPFHWNKQWENVVEQMVEKRLLSDMMECSKGDCDSEGILSNHRQRVQGLQYHQKGLTNYAAECFAVHDFESKWLGSTIAVRQRHILEGLVRTSAIGTEDARTFCPELTLVGLEKGNGRGYFDLLNYFMVDDTSESTSESTTSTPPILLLNPRLDEQMGKGRKDLSENDKILHAYFDGVRSFFICIFLLYTLESFHGRDQKPVYPSKGPSREGFTSYTRTDAYKLQTPIDRGVRHEKRVYEKSAVASCEYCHRREKDFEVRKSFMVCNACRNAVGRRIYYCSKECQRNDWKPRHKFICGKKMTLEGANVTAPLPLPALGSRQPKKDPLGLFETIIPAKPGYRRSPALLYQIFLLNSQNDPEQEASYFFMPSSEDICLIVIPDTISKALFHNARAQAMASGDRAAVVYLAQHFASAHDLPPEVVFKQLTKEYGFDVQSAVADSEIQRIKENGGLTELQLQKRDFMSRNEFLHYGIDTLEQKLLLVIALRAYLRSLP